MGLLHRAGGARLFDGIFATNRRHRGTVRKVAAAVLSACLVASTGGTALAADPSASPAASSPPTHGGKLAPAGAASPGSYGAPIVLPRDGTVVVQTVRTIQALSTDDLSLAQPTSEPLVGDAAHTSTVVSVGQFSAGTSLVFALHSSFTNQTYLSTGSNALVLQSGTDHWAVGWEDWTDYNYSDVVMLVCYGSASTGCPISPTMTFGLPSGEFAGPQAYQSEPVNTATGNYTNQVTDASLPGPGLALALTRTYNSLLSATGILGPGWSFSYGAHVVADADGSATYVAPDGAQATYAPDGAGGFIRPPGAYDVLTAVSGGGYQILRRDQVRYLFDASGRLTSVVDRNGNTIALSYTSGQLTTITDTVGRQVGLSYNPDGTLARLDLPLGFHVSYAYSDGLLSSVTDVRGGTTTYGYDAPGRLTSITDQNGHALVTNAYGPDGRVSDQWDALGDHTTFAWDASTGTSTMTDARGGTWVDRYQAGILMSQADPLGDTTQYAFDAQLGMSAMTDPRGNTTKTTLDSFGSTTLVQYPGSPAVSESWTYNSLNEPLTHVDGRGNTTSYTYDPAGNLLTVTGPGPVSPVTRYAYDPSGDGLLASVTDPLGHATSFGYDAQRNRTSVTTPLGEVTTMTYDAAGRMLTSVDPRGNAAGGNPSQYTTTYAYDAAGNVLSVTDPLGNATSSTWDPAGNRLTSTDANQHTTTYGYDAGNHLTSVTDAASHATAYGYDAVGNLVSRTDANGHQTAYAYDLAKRMTGQVDPLGGSWTYAYDADGNRTQVVDANGNATPTAGDGTTTYTYDELNRVTEISYSDGTWGNGFAYDADGNRTTVVDAAGTTTYAHDSLNRLTSWSRGTAGIAYTYDAAGDILTRTPAGGVAATYTYDADGRMSTASTAAGTTAYAYDPAGELLTTALPSGNGYAEARTYDPAGRLTGVTNANGATVLSESLYLLDPVGNRLTSTTTTGTTSYTYDALNRLTRACFTSACTGSDNFRSYTYDPVGNRLTEGAAAGTTSYTYNAADELTQSSGPSGSPTYTYDADGNQLTGTGATLTYNLAGEVATAAVGRTTTIYTYDADGNRTKASTGSAASKNTQYVWDPTTPGVPLLARETDGSGGAIRDYTYGLDQIAMTTGGKAYYYAHDGIGSVVNVTSSTGKTEWTYDYLPYGGFRTNTKNDSKAPANVLNFAGQYLDPTALYYMRARQYDPATGRFTATDPAVAAVPGARYAYAANNPVLLIDASGRCPMVLAGVSAILFGALGTAAEPGGGTFAGGALGYALVVAALCPAETAVEINVAKTIDQKQGQTIPQPRTGPTIDVPWNPDAGSQPNPYTGEPEPPRIPPGGGSTVPPEGGGPAGMGKKAAALLALLGLVGGNALLGEEGGYAPSPGNPPPQK